MSWGTASKLNFSEKTFLEFNFLRSRYSAPASFTGQGPLHSMTLSIYIHFYYFFFMVFHLLCSTLKTNNIWAFSSSLTFREPLFQKWFINSCSFSSFLHYYFNNKTFGNNIGAVFWLERILWGVNSAGKINTTLFIKCMVPISP